MSFLPLSVERALVPDLRRVMVGYWENGLIAHGPNEGEHVAERENGKEGTAGDRVAFTAACRCGCPVVAGHAGTKVSRETRTDGVGVSVSSAASSACSFSILTLIQ